MKPSKPPSPEGRKFDSTTSPRPGRLDISTLGSAIERFESTRTTVPHSAAPHGAISTSMFPLAERQRPVGSAAAAGAATASTVSASAKRRMGGTSAEVNDDCIAPVTGATRGGVTKRRQSYHHGRLREALIEAAERMIEDEGPESVTVREAARRAGVSPGAPFRHFASRKALMTAVAERAMQRFRDEIARAEADVDPADPLARFAALGRAYVRWALRHPASFRVLATRSLIDFDGSPTLGPDNDAIRALMQEIVADGQKRGQMRRADPALVELAAKALSYGLARMYVDGHFPQWGVPARRTEAAMRAVLGLFRGLLAR